MPNKNPCIGCNRKFEQCKLTCDFYKDYIYKEKDNNAK